MTFEGESGTQGAVPCWLCCRPLGQRCEWHHPVPKSRGGRDVVPLHPICHRTIHACFDNARLARIGADRARLVEDPALARFVAWIASKPPDFHARTASRISLRSRTRR
ncbi:HNH endonuclease [Novosphingobium pituita]|uniref:HNH endonuclease n=1 Tax=Novosphingobium pituita TaxID=3056842 RepID=UPI00295EEAFB|nr:HNH endonuclease [Novosphingobium sp. IK01]MDK4806307.1 HNH endonuclease [Novosphingobium aromaticivorans]